MAKKMIEVPVEDRVRATIIELNFYGIVGHAIFINNVNPNDIDTAIKTALESRFPNAVTIRNENIEYENDLKRLIESYCGGEYENRLTVQLRTFSPTETIDYHIWLRIYWSNAPDNIRMPDITIYHDCHEYDCDTIAKQMEDIQPITKYDEEIITMRKFQMHHV